MESDEGGVLRLEGGSNDDDLDSVNDLLHWLMEDYELFPSCNMLRVNEGEKGEENECPKEYREAEEGKADTTEAKGKNILYKPSKRKDSTVWYIVNGSCRKKMLRRTTDLVERYWPQGKHIIRSAQETKRKGLIKTLAVWSEGSKIKSTVIDIKEWQPTKLVVPSLRIAIKNKLGDMESLREIV